MGGGTLTYLQKSKVWNTLEFYKLKNSLGNKYKYIFLIKFISKYSNTSHKSRTWKKNI